MVATNRRKSTVKHNKFNDILSVIPNELIDSISSHVKNQSDLQELVMGIKKRVVESALNAELSHHLDTTDNPDNYRNGYSEKTLQTETGSATISIPRDRYSEFDPILVKKHARRLEGIDNAVLALYARGMSVRDIKSTILELYDHELSEDLISDITDSITNDVIQWQNRPLESSYPIMYLDCITIKVQDNKSIINKAIYLALGINTDGHKELLGIWISPNEGAKFWLQVLTEIKSRGVQDIFIACCDGLTGFPDAINAVYPSCEVQLCIVHMVRNSLRYVPHKDKKIVAADLKSIYNSNTEELALQNLEAFTLKWNHKYPAISKSWNNNWGNISSIFHYTEEIRKVIYTTNAIESLNMTLRKVTKNKRVFPHDGAVFKTLYLALQNIEKRWTMPIYNWPIAYQQLLIRFGKL